MNSQLDVLRYQTRLLLDFELMSAQRYEYVSHLINGIGSELGGWIKHQKQQNRADPKLKSPYPKPKSQKVAATSPS